MRFRFNVLLNGFVLVSVAVQSATAEALAHVEILNGQGTKIDDADITSTDQGFQIAVKASNSSPGEHGSRFRTVGKCEDAAFASAVGRFNPTFAHHGAHNTFVADGVALGDGVNSLFHERSNSLVIHAKPDDLMSDPSRNSGDRMACGVLQN